jgi:CDP-diacylglycerol---glycerol-3-phosphate 3-phosphatidyltransferase
MPSLYDIKPRFQALLRPLVAVLARAGITPNALTAAALLLSAAVGALLCAFHNDAWPLALLPPALLLRMALNALDGMLARQHDMKTPLGAILNELGDVTSDALLYLPFARRPAVAPALIIAVVLLGTFAEFAGVLAATLGASRRYDGPLGKSDRALAFALLALAMLCPFLQYPLWINYALAALALLAAFTILQRVRNALREVSP